jgi:hypothetical protein
MQINCLWQITKDISIYKVNYVPNITFLRRLFVWMLLSIHYKYQNWTYENVAPVAVQAPPCPCFGP